MHTDNLQQTNADMHQSRIYKPTASNKASMKALGEKISRRPEKEHAISEEPLPERSLEECLRTLSPIEPTSRLLVSTQATIKAEYHAEEPKSDFRPDVTPLPPTSHLLAPTAASRHGAFNPPSAPEQNTSRPPSPARPIPVSSRLTAFNTVRKAAVYEKKVVEIDPREKGWDSRVFKSHSPDADMPAPPGSPTPGHKSTPSSVSKKYQHVKSRLQTPTKASRLGQWSNLSSPSSPCKVNPNIQSTPPESGESTGPKQPLPRCTSRGKYSNVSSRLHKPTVASELCKYQKPEDQKSPRSKSPTTRAASPSYAARGGKSSSTAAGTDTASPVRVPSPLRRSDSVTKRSTSAQKNGQRSKFVKPPDEADMANCKTRPRTRPGKGRPVVIDPSAAPPIRSITQIRSQIKSIMDNIKAGYVFNDFLLEQLIDELHAHPSYGAKKEARQSVWRNRFLPRAQKSLERMLAFIPPMDKLSPPDGKPASLLRLVQDGLSRALAERILSLKCLWLLRMDPADMALLTLEQLKKLTANALTELDMVEVCAVYAVLPYTFDEGEDGGGDGDVDEYVADERRERQAWQLSFEKGLQHLLEQEHDHALPFGRVRATAYVGQSAVYAKGGECEVGEEGGGGEDMVEGDDDDDDEEERENVIAAQDKIHL
jgi:hypothetical protein